MLFKENIKLIVVHCSDTPNDQNINAENIHKLHINFGWDGIGYHKVILRSGRIELGRPEYWIGAHVKGLNNISLGVCLIGRDVFTKNQFESLENILKQWKQSYPNADIIGHCDVEDTSKTCPNFNVKTWLKNRCL